MPIIFINSGVDRSSLSDTKNVFPDAAGFLIQQIIKSIKFSIPTNDRAFLIFEIGSGIFLNTFVWNYKLLHQVENLHNFSLPPLNL